jgi:hypothetical protein
MRGGIELSLFVVLAPSLALSSLFLPSGCRVLGHQIIPAQLSKASVRPGSLVKFKIDDTYMIDGCPPFCTSSNAGRAIFDVPLSNMILVVWRKHLYRRKYFIVYQCISTCVIE